MELFKSFVVCALAVMATTNGFKLRDNHGNHVIKTFPMITEDIYTGLKDYIQLDDENAHFEENKNYYNRSLSPTAESIDAIVEIAIVCDKEWGDLFQHNRQEALEYWTLFFWDVNTKFQTLPSVNVTFRVTSVTVISSFEEQPFLEESRDENGAASFGTVISKFGDWIATRLLAGQVAKYDIAILATSTLMRESGIAGMAYVNGACSINRGVGLFRNWGILDTHVASHEIAHILGASHDHEIYWCTESGYIMENEADKKYFFSWCSDYQISQLVKSRSCLRTIDEPADPVIGQGFEGVLPPTVQEQCQKRVGDPKAVVPDAELGKCRDILCWASPQNGGYGIRMGVAENSECVLSFAPWGNEYGRCFRGRCQATSAQLINVASNECLMSSGGRFSSTDNTTAVVTGCPQHQTPLNAIHQTYWNYGVYLQMSYATEDASEISEKCFVYEEEQNKLRFVKCSDIVWGNEEYPANWKLIDVGNEQFLLSHTVSKKCVKQAGNLVEIADNCDQNDKSMVWRFRK